jgi:hypothetical protein
MLLNSFVQSHLIILVVLNYYQFLYTFVKNMMNLFYLPLNEIYSIYMLLIIIYIEPLLDLSQMLKHLLLTLLPSFSTHLSFDDPYLF